MCIRDRLANPSEVHDVVFDDTRNSTKSVYRIVNSKYDSREQYYSNEVSHMFLKPKTLSKNGIRIVTNDLGYQELENGDVRKKDLVYPGIISRDQELIVVANSEQAKVLYSLAKTNENVSVEDKGDQIPITLDLKGAGSLLTESVTVPLKEYEQMKTRKALLKLARSYLSEDSKLVEKSLGLSFKVSKKTQLHLPTIDFNTLAENTIFSLRKARSGYRKLRSGEYKINVGLKKKSNKPRAKRQ